MMRFAMLATASAIALVFTIGSVSAADQFTTLRGVKAVQMSAGELSSVKGMDHHFQVNTPGQGFIDPNNSPNAKPFSVSGAGVSRFGTDWHNEETMASLAALVTERLAPPTRASVAPVAMG